MAKPNSYELLRDLDAAIGKAKQIRKSLAQNPHTAPALGFGKLEWVTRKECYDWLQSQDLPAKEALSHWVAALLHLRVNLKARAMGLAWQLSPQVRLSKPEKAEVSFAQARALCFAHPKGYFRSEILKAMAEQSHQPRRVEVQIAQRRVEIATRLGLAETNGHLHCGMQQPALQALAEGLLSDTEESYGRLRGGELYRDWLGYGGKEAVPYPRRLAPALFLDSLSHEAGWFTLPKFFPGDFCQLWGPASFTRAFARFGAGWAEAARPRDLPRPLAERPNELVRLRMGALMCLLLQIPGFTQKAFGLSRRQAMQVARGQAIAGLLQLRLGAAMVLCQPLLEKGLKGDGLEYAQSHLGRALWADPERPYPLAFLMPRQNPLWPSKILSQLLAHQWAMELREAFDEDWYRNPKAVEALRDWHARHPILGPDEPELQNARRSQLAWLQELARAQ